MSDPVADHPVARLLVKRARLQPLDHVQFPSQPKTKRLRQHLHPDRYARVQNCLELCSLLLEKVGTDPSASDPAVLHDILSKEYSPRALELLVNITEALDTDADPYNDSVLTSPSDHDTDSDAVVPSFFDCPSPLSVSQNEAVVPQLSSKPSKDGKDKSVQTLLKTASQSCPAPTYNKQTEIAISRIFNLGQVASVQDNTIHPDAPYHGPSVVTMTGFGELGRFGNQVIQYMFLKAYAIRHNIEEIQVPSWVGAGLFGLNDRPVERALPPVVEFHGTLANSTFTGDLIEFVKRSNAHKAVPEIYPAALEVAEGTESEPQKNVDVWGWFQWHTSHFAPFKHHIRKTFEPVPALKQHLTTIFESKLRYKDGKRRTVVGLHIRLGDYQNIAASSFGYCAPTSWYIQWLQKIWPTLENPVLFVASDDVNAVLKDFAAYRPVTCDSIGMHMPPDMKEMKAGFFPDWYSLTLCDVVAISNSTFSFTACLMNRRKNARFFRAHYRGEIVPINPWECDPIVHRNMNKGGLSAAFETLQVLYNTQGSRGLAKNLLYELPYYGLRAAIMKAVLWRQAQRNSACAVP